MPAVTQWIHSTPALKSAAQQLHMEMDEFSQWLTQALVKSGAAKLEGAYFIDHG